MQNLQGRSRLARRLVLGLAIAAIAAPVAQADLKTLTDYPPAIAREAARSYGPLPATPIQVVGKSDGFDWGDAAVDMATALGLVLLGAAALAGVLDKSRPTG